MATASVEQARAHARALEADLDRYPEERGDILLEAAGEWERAGDVDRARTLLAEVLALGGDDADWARYNLASMCFQEGADADGWAYLEALARTDAPGPAKLVAELLEERGDHAAR